jgi:hypothetical protein
MTGIQRGLYEDEQLTLNQRCFGEYYVQKFNEYAYTFEYNPFGNFFDNAWPEMYLTYMLYYMITNECGLDHTFNDYATYCWYKGCWPMQLVYESGDKFLYILRAVNDAAIIWKEGMDEVHAHPELNYEQEDKQWSRLSAKTGQSMADIFQDLTGFYPLTEQEKY